MSKKWHDCGKDLMAALQQSVNNLNVKLPGVDKKEEEKKIQFLCDSQDDSTIYISLGAQAVGLTKNPLNMQTDTAAFEAWALILRAHYRDNINIRLTLKEGVTLPDGDVLSGKKYGHYNRFLYRVMKFQEQYGWFKIDDDQHGLIQAIKNFEAEYTTKSFCNNVPTDDASDNPSNLEGMVEAAFAKDAGEPGEPYIKRLTSARGVDLEFACRQLPVGLFLGEHSSDHTRVFTGNHSAIDLWGLSKDRTKLVIYELKTLNKMVGIITELMFYANYMYDMYIEKSHFKPLSPKKSKKDWRGYQKLFDADNLAKIQAYMLTDGLHPLVTPEVLNEMNKSGLAEKILYDTLSYSLRISIETDSGQCQVK